MFGRKLPPVSTDDRKIRELLTRGVENVIPKELAEKKLKSGERLRVYLGIDPTGSKLHLGHAVPLRKLAAFSELGHEVIFVVGSFTAMIGDPSGRDLMREPLSREAVEENFKDYKRQAEKVLDFSRVTVRYNHEWLEKLGFSDIVKLASHFTVQQLIAREMFQRRIQEGKPVGLHEFLYPLMVGYDSVVLDVDCELGGSDQEFNILAGRHLQTAMKKRDKFVLTTKLIEGTDGRKMSKTYDNAVYLDDSPRDMFGKLMSVKDELMPAYYEALTDLPREEYEKALAGHPKSAKAALAEEIVAMYHGKKAAADAKENFDEAFAKGGIPADIPEAPWMGSVMDSVLASGGASSKSEYRRLEEANAVKVLSEDGEGVTVKVGKHRFFRFKK